jgi:SAM-dependent methyltransferase
VVGHIPPEEQALESAPDVPSPDFLDEDFQTPAVWDALAEWWDDKIGEGNATQDLLVEPTQERLLGLKSGERVLDIACGAGRFTRRMAAKGVRIVAFDHSDKFIARAKERTPPELAERIDYLVLDANDTDALLALAEHQFDAAVCTMAVMDMARISPLFSALPRLLTAEGRFVFSVTHPVFNSGDARLVAERVRRGRAFETELSIKVTNYLTPRMQRDIGIAGQPVEQHYFHRPISMLLNACFDHGFVLDGSKSPHFRPPTSCPDAEPSVG